MFGDSSQRSRTPVDRRSVLKTLGGGIAATGLAGCLGGGGGGSTDTLRYLGWGGNTQDAAATAFEYWTEESGVEVEHQSAGGDSEFLSIIRENPGEIDLFMPTSFGVYTARQEDLLADINYDDLPNYQENIQQDWADRPYIDGDAVFRDALTQGYAYNTEETDREMSTWDDIKADEFEDSLGLRDQATSRVTNAAASLGMNINDVPGNSDAVEQVRQELGEQHENTFGYWGAGAESIRWLREGTATVAETWGGRTRALQEEGYEEIEYVIPEGGTSTITEDWAIPASSENQDLVHDLLNHVFQRDIIVELSDNVGYPVPVQDPPEVIRNLPDYTESPDDLMWVDWGTVDPAVSDWQQMFQEVKQG
nr:PotD/PotF family extracellular solute-binding protein [Haloplanus salinarum]